MLLLMTLSMHCICLSQELNDWLLEINVAYQDKLTQHSEKGIWLFDGFYGTDDTYVYEYGIRLHRKIVKWRKSNVQIGLGLSKKTVAKSIGVNHCFGTDGFCYSNLALKKNYTISQLQMPVGYSVNVLNNLALKMQVMPNFKFHQNTSTSVEPKFSFVFESLEILPEIAWFTNKFGIGMGCRIFNVQRKEEVFIYDILFNSTNPDYFSDSYELDNPLKLFVALKYVF